VSLFAGIAVKTIFSLWLAVFIPLGLTACSREAPSVDVAPAREEANAATADAADITASGTVTETMNTGGYTYVQVDTGSAKVWAAAPECVVKVGDQVAIPRGMSMHNFHSDTLDRDFELVYFVNSIQDLAGKPLTSAQGLPAGHPPTPGHSSLSQKPNPDEIDVGGLEKAEGGRTVADIYANKTDLSGQEVVLRGKVVKYNHHIMGKNWLHVRDGSGDADAGTHDLTVTTDVAAKVGDTVLVTGNVQLDKDFGYGYQYDVIIEDARVEVE
jgi:hypothetical protein